MALPLGRGSGDCCCLADQPDSGDRLPGSLFAPLADVTANLRLLEHIKNKGGANCRTLLSVMPKRNQAVLNLLDGFRWQPDRNLDALAITLFTGHGAM
jgi:hypothetical protein